MCHDTSLVPTNIAKSKEQYKQGLSSVYHQIFPMCVGAQSFGTDGQNSVPRARRIRCSPREPSGLAPLGHWQRGGAQGMTGLTGKPRLAHMQGHMPGVTCLIHLPSSHDWWAAVVSWVCGAG